MIPRSVYLVDKPVDAVSSLPQDLKHICINKHEVGELVLRIALSIKNITYDEAPEIYGYIDINNNDFYFLNKEQHVKMGTPAVCNSP